MATKLRAKVRTVAPLVSWVRWSNRVGSIEDANRRKSIAYIGFPDKASADKFYLKVTQRRPDWKWKQYPQEDGQTEFDGEGITKPRRAERLTEFAYEVKWHRPPLEFIEGLIRWDVGQTVEGYKLTEYAYNNL